MPRGGAEPGPKPDQESREVTREGLTIRWVRARTAGGARDPERTEIYIHKTRNRGLHLDRNEAMFALRMLQDFLDENDVLPRPKGG